MSAQEKDMKPSRAAVVVLVLSGLFLALPSGLPAKERRGAEIIVTRLDGSGIKGELIAVKPDSLLLLSEGKDVSIGRADVHTVVIIRKSQAGLLAAVGGAAGAAAGVVLGLNWNFEAISDSRAGGAVFGGAAIGAGGALLGYLAGQLTGRDPSFTVAGRQEADAARFWTRLKALSREGTLPKIAPAPAAMPDPPAATERPVKITEAPADRVARPAPSSPAGADAEPPGPGWKRLRISVSAALPAGTASTAYANGNFYFPMETIPEFGPYVIGVSQWTGTGRSFNRVGLGPIGLAYAWNRHWSIDAEIYVHSGNSSSWASSLSFTSSGDGQDYESGFYHGYTARFVSVLLGASYHPLAHGPYQRHDVEIGAAAGPAFVRGTPYTSDMAGVFSLPAFQKIVPSGRILVGYDYYFVPSVSLGFFAGYRLMEKKLTGAVASGLAGFWEAGADPGAPPSFERLTEVSLPAHSLKGSAAFVGLRIAARI
jgi:hypothetical protein